MSATTSGSSTGGDPSSTGPADDSAGSSAVASTSAGTLDVGTLMDFGPVQPAGCKGKVDLLFLISRTGTMVTEQTQLLASFPGFVKTIEEKLAGFDVHIMAANPDGTWPGMVCETGGGCLKYSPNCGPDAEDYQCGTYAQLFTECDKELGAGLIFNAGGGAANRQCELYGAHRYIISGQPNMDDALDCIAKVGWSGDNIIGEALVAALSYNLNKPGGCNDGFLREDALLVVTVISDTHDQESLTWPYQWYDKILAAKKDPSAVVMLGIVPQPHVDGEPWLPDCTYVSPNDPNGKIRDLIDMFPYHHYGDTCAPSYAPFFDEAAGMIDEACGSFIPQ